MTQAHHEGSAFLRHTPCPDCGSSDACAVYDDGHTYCFSCETHVESGEEAKTPEPAAGLITDGVASAIHSRKLTQETCQHFGYKKTKHRGKPAQVASYYDDTGRMVAQKVRYPGKDFAWLGDMKPKDVLPYGAHVWPRTGRKLVVTEGEIDALVMSQVQGNKWPVVSIPTGAGRKTVRRYFARHLEYFDGFEEVVLMFDEDDAGREATEAAAEVLGARASVARLPLKDPSEMLVEGRSEELIRAMWGAKKYRPEGIVDLASLKDSVLKEPEWGLSWPFEFLTNWTYGIRLGELYALGAGTGIGKTDMFTQTMMHFVRKHHQKIGVFALEQEPKETATRLLGKLAEHPFHVPDAGWTMEDFENAWEKYVQDDRVYLYDSFGINDWDAVKAKVRYLRDAEGVRYFFLDHLTALAAWQEDERRALENIMAEMGGLVKEKGGPITIFFISHLATPEGKPHEEGGRVKIRHFKGSRAIGFWSHFMFGMERDQQHENDIIRTTTTFRCLKDRYTGRSTGNVDYLGYDQDTGLLYPTAPPPTDSASDYGFSTTKEEEDSPLPADF